MTSSPGTLAHEAGQLSLDRLTAGHPLAVKALRQLRWSRAELAEIVRIVQPSDNEDAITYAMLVSGIRRLIEAQPDRYLELMREAAK